MSDELGEVKQTLGRIEGQVQEVQRTMGRIASWMDGHDGQGEQTTHAAIKRTMTEQGEQITKAKTVFGTATFVLSAGWTGLVAWWKT